MDQKQAWCQKKKKKMASQSENSGMELILYTRDPAGFLFLKALVQCTTPAFTRKH